MLEQDAPDRIITSYMYLRCIIQGLDCGPMNRLLNNTPMDEMAR